MSGRGEEELPSSPGGEWQSAASRRTRNSNRTGAGSSKGSERSRAARGSGRSGGARGGQRGGQRGADGEGRSAQRAKQPSAAPEATGKAAPGPAAAAAKPAGADGVAEQLFSARVDSPVTASGFDATTAVQMLTSRMAQVHRAAKTGASIDQCKVVAYQQRALPAKSAWGK